MELLAVIFLFAFWGMVALLLLYYINLIQEKNEYYKEELIGPDKIVAASLNTLTSSRAGGASDSLSAYIALAIGAVLAYITTLLGGLLNESHAGSYIFHSCFLVVALYFTYETLYDVVSGGNAESGLGKIFSFENGFFFGFAIMIVAANFAAWGVHSGTYPDTVPFLWILINNGVALGFLVFKLRTNKAQTGGSEDEFPGEDSPGPDAPSVGDYPDKPGDISEPDV